MTIEQQTADILNTLRRIQQRHPKQHQEILDHLRAVAAESLNRLRRVADHEKLLAQVEATRKKLEPVRDRYPELYREFMEQHYYPAKASADTRENMGKAHFLRQVDILALKYGIRDVILRWDDKGKRRRVFDEDVDPKRIPNMMIVAAEEWIDDPQVVAKLRRRFGITEYLAKALVEEVRWRTRR